MVKDALDSAGEVAKALNGLPIGDVRRALRIALIMLGHDELVLALDRTSKESASAGHQGRDASENGLTTGRGDPRLD